MTVQTNCSENQTKLLTLSIHTKLMVIRKYFSLYRDNETRYFIQFLRYYLFEFRNWIKIKFLCNNFTSIPIWCALILYDKRLFTWRLFKHETYDKQIKDNYIRIYQNLLKVDDSTQSFNFINYPTQSLGHHRDRALWDFLLKFGTL